MTITVRIFIISLLLFFLNTGCIAAPQGQMQLFLPPSLSTCMPIQIQWNNAIGPTANISVFTLTNQSTLNVEPARRFSNLDAETGSYLWRIDLPSNQNVIVRLTDSAGRLVDSPPTTIVRSVASEPPCKNNHIVPSLFQQMSFKGPVGVEPPRLITSLPKQVPALIVNGTVIAKFNTPMFLNSSSAQPIVPVVMPKIGKINDTAPVMVVNPNGSSVGILMPAVPATNVATQNSFNFYFYCSSLILVTLSVFAI